jgi:hypothetical protein
MSLDYQGDKGTYGQAGQSYGDRERPGQSSVDTGRTSHHPGVGPTKTSTKTVSPKDHFEQSWTGQPGFLGLGGGYKTLKTPGDTSAGHRSSFNPLGMMLGFINPALGMAVKGFQGLQNLGTKYGTKMGDWREKFTGYRTQADWERARQNRINEKRMGYLSDRKAKGLGYGKQAYEDLLSQGYSDSFQDAINKDLEINPEQSQFARTHLQSVAKNLPENIKALISKGPMGDEMFSNTGILNALPKNTDNWFDTHPATGESVMTPEFKNWFVDKRTYRDIPSMPETWQKPDISPAYSYMDTSFGTRDSVNMKPYSYSYSPSDNWFDQSINFDEEKFEPYA